MRCRVTHTSSIDGVMPGEVGDFNPAVVRGLLRTGKLVPVEGGEMPDPRELHAADDALVADYDRKLAAKDARITELEVELAQAKLDLEAATAPKGEVETSKARQKREG